MSKFDIWHDTFNGSGAMKMEQERIAFESGHSIGFNAGLEAAASHIVSLYPSYGSLDHLKSLADEVRKLKEPGT